MPNEKADLKSTCFLHNQSQFGKAVQKAVISSDNNELMCQNKIKSKED